MEVLSFGGWMIIGVIILVGTQGQGRIKIDKDNTENPSVKSISAPKSLLNWLTKKSTREPDVYGLHIVFKKQFSDKEKDQLHKSLDTELIYRPETVSYETVRRKNKKLSLTEAKKLCIKYQANSAVLDCAAAISYGLPNCDVRNPASTEGLSSSCLPSTTSSKTDPNQLYYSETPYCEFLPKEIEDPKGKKVRLASIRSLPPLWSQYITGAKLARDLVKNAPELEKKVVRITNVDGPMVAKKKTKYAARFTKDFQSIDNDLKDECGESHAEMTTSLMASQSEIGFSENGYIAMNIAAGSCHGLQPLSKIADIISAKKKSDIINLEIHSFCHLKGCTVESSIERKAIDQIARHGIVVAAAGNRREEASELHGEADIATCPNIIIVGNLSRTGVPSSTSNRSKCVTIAAPGTRGHVTSYIQNEFNYQGGDTSAAVAMVSGALADVVSILGDLSTEEARILLQKTAVRTLNYYDKDNKSGAGMLNAYKLIRVAQRLKEAGWPANRKKLINDKKYFDFTSEVGSYRYILDDHEISWDTEAKDPKCEKERAPCLESERHNQYKCGWETPACKKFCETMKKVADYGLKRFLLMDVADYGEGPTPLLYIFNNSKWIDAAIFFDHLRLEFLEKNIREAFEYSVRFDSDRDNGRLAREILKYPK